VAAVLLGGVAEPIIAGAAFGAGRALMTTARFVSGSRDAWDKQLELNVWLVTAICAATTTGCVIATALAR
jgi:hypothetical protein